MKAPCPEPFSTVLFADRETRRNADYRFDNYRRSSGDEGVVQQILHGIGFIQDATGRHLVPAGHAMLFTHDESSSYGYPPEVTEPLHIHYVSFRLSALRPWFERLRAEFGAVVRMPLEGVATNIFTEITRRVRERSFQDRLQQTELLHQLLVALYREQVAATATRDPIEYGYHQLCDHFRSPQNLKELAARCGVSREHFIRAFGRRYGEPPGELLRRLRLEHAHRLLRATRVPVQEVATACGFTDANSFSRAYRHLYGTTPSYARQR